MSNTNQTKNEVIFEQVQVALKNLPTQKGSANRLLEQLEADELANLLTILTDEQPNASVMVFRALVDNCGVKDALIEIADAQERKSKPALTEAEEAARDQLADEIVDELRAEGWG